MTSLSTATQRVLQLPHVPAAADAYRAVGVSTTLSLDSGAALIAITADGTATLVDGDHPPQATGTGTDGSVPGVDVEMSLSSADLLSLADGELTVLRALTTSRVAAHGPIFAAIGTVHALTHL